MTYIIVIFRLVNFKVGVLVSERKTLKTIRSQ
jgi:hypothetical protein